MAEPETADCPARARLLAPEPADPEPTPKPKDRGGATQYFENCDAIHASGLAPLTRGDGVYEQNTHMDRDGDGVASE